MRQTPDRAVDTFNKGFGRHPGFRSLHARGRFYTATFTATPEAGALCRAAHLSGEPVRTLVRLSNGSGNPNAPDRVPDVRGMAVSFRPAEGVTTDLLGQTAPRFPARSVDDFVALTYAASQVKRKPWLLAAFVARHPYVLPALAANAKAGALKPPRSFAAATFYAVHAYKWLDKAGGSRWVRYTWLPDPSAEPAPTPERGDPQYLHHEFERRLAQEPARFTLQVQVAIDGDDPDDPTSVWKGTQRIDAGVLEIEAPDADTEQHGDVVVFDPVRVIDGIELPDDPILAFRPLAYSASVKRRV
jgi:catalase